MRIGIDARLIEETGVGRYIRNLLSNLALLDTKNTYVVFLRKKSFDSFVLPGNNWKKVIADVPWHTITEQCVMPFILQKEHCDVVHIPYHNPPIFYPGNMIITIHDLIILHFDTGKATTLPLFLYKIKRFGYWLELTIGLHRAKKIIAVSEATKKEIIDNFYIPENNITVTYEGVDTNLTKNGKRVTGDEKNYFLYVGNAYPHKNLEILLDVFSNMQEKIIFVGREDYFYKKLKQKVVRMHLEKLIHFYGPANDMQLSDLYTHAKALVFPSLMEGFGLPGLEALSLGCPVVCADIPVFHEIFGDTATYFDSSNLVDITKKLQNIPIKKIPLHFFDKFDWKKLATKTIYLYENSICL
jgi:glycosyltransferase involved in cell wall biosynthesis